jgi:Zn finger protein HypA/HybF involved in hydrogenase expression
MKRIRILGLALLALFAFGVVIASTAAAEEKEPAGLLFLPKEEPPVVLEGSGGASKLETLPGKTAINCTANTFKGTAGTKGETHVTLGAVTIDFTGCTGPLGVACSSENAKGEKDPAKTILVVGDLHFVSLETAAGKLVPGVQIILLEAVKLNCAGISVIVEGVAIGEIIGASASQDVTGITLNFVAIPSLLPCDKNDKLCKEEKEKFACPKSGSLCSKVGGGESENADQIAKEVKVTFKPMVLIDF